MIGVRHVGLALTRTLLAWAAILSIEQPLSAAEVLSQRPLDCVVEPRLTVKLGAAVAGLITSIAIDRVTLLRH